MRERLMRRERATTSPHNTADSRSFQLQRGSQAPRMVRRSERRGVRLHRQLLNRWVVVPVLAPGLLFFFCSSRDPQAQWGDSGARAVAATSAGPVMCTGGWWCFTLGLGALFPNSVWSFGCSGTCSRGVTGAPAPRPVVPNLLFLRNCVFVKFKSFFFII